MAGTWSCHADDPVIQGLYDRGIEKAGSEVYKHLRADSDIVDAASKRLSLQDS